MLRVLFFVLIVFALGFGFSRLADFPGEAVLTFGNQEVTVSLMVAAVAVVSIVVAVMLIWWVFKVIFTSPDRVKRFFRSRRRDRGYQSLSTGMIAAGAGDSMAARKMLKQANGLLDSTTEPLIKLLDAQATMLEGNHDDARKKFEDMLDDPETRILGLRGLYMEAQRLGDRDAQKHYAEKAAELAPQLSWASRAALDLKTANGDWNGAIRLLDKQKSTKLITKEENNRKRAVLLTGMAMEHLENDPAKAKSAALEAHKLAPDFVPASVAAAESAFRLSEIRRGVKVLETTWKKEPHPDLALAYVNAKVGDTAKERLKKAKRLETLQPGNNETHMIVAQMALEAGDFGLARSKVAQVLASDPRESAFMLMADIEEAETGDQGRMREWLSRAVRAPRDAVWTADGYVSEKWAPFSPVTGKIDAFEWKVPLERLGGAMIDNDLEPLDPLEAGSPPATEGIVDVSGATAVAAAAADFGDNPTMKKVQVDLEARNVESESDIETHDVVIVEPSSNAGVASQNDIETHDVVVVEASSTDNIDDANKTDNDPDADVAADADADTGVEADIDNDAAAEKKTVKTPIPDDPGVAKDNEPAPDKRFRLF